MLLSMLLPMLLVAVGWIVLEVHPFGTRQILVTDFWHQYYPFLCILQEKLKHGESLLYTWQSGMGSNFAAMMAYYTASPLNLLTLLVPASMLRDAVTGLVLLKIGAAGGFFAAFLKGTYGRNDIPSGHPVIGQIDLFGNRGQSSGNSDLILFFLLHKPFLLVQTVVGRSDPGIRDK